MARRLIITRGLPGCGKTTEAKRMAELMGYVCVSRDEVRLMLWGKPYGHPGVDEPLVTMVEEDIVATLLCRGRTVVVHDTCLPQEHADRWEELAGFHLAQFEVLDMRQVSLQQCLENNEYRKGTTSYIKPEVIGRLHAQYVRDRFE